MAKEKIPMWKKGLNALRRGLALMCAALLGGALAAASAAESAATYCVIDLSAGADATSYPVSYLNAVPEGGWTDEYKTTKLVLRRCPAGEDPLGHYTFTEDFYAGVFEVTETQWANVMGGSSLGTKPVSISYNAIRGNARIYDWPVSTAVASDSFIGRIRAKTGLDRLDLPSEVEWEYAARAGVATDWLCGYSDANLGDYAWYSRNSGSEMHPVGTRRANAWGIYDVHGNAWEWCLNRYSTHIGYYDCRVVRGGGCDWDASRCAFAYRDACVSYERNHGFRLFCTTLVSGAYGPFVPGEPVSLDIPDLVGYAAKGLPAGLKLNAKTGAITGAATKPTGEAGVTVMFTKKGAETFTTQFVVGPFPVLSVAAPDAPAGCKATGAGAYAAGRKVTLKATAAKGFVFAGWYADADFRTPLAGDVDFRTPSYSYVMPTSDVSLFARFLPVDEDAAALRLPSVASEYAPNEAVKLALDVSGCVSLPTVKVAGLPPGLKFTAKALDVKATKTAPAAHYAANTIYGAPTRSGIYAATVTVTTAGKRTATETILFAVVDRGKDEYILKIASDATKGRVTGAGVYAKGKKVALRATPAKGFVFAGWYADTDFTKSLMDDSDYRTPSLPYEMPGSDVTVHARFLPAEEDGGIALSVNGQTAAEEAPGSVYHASGEWRMELSVSSASLPTVTLTGLPAGLKFTAKGLDVKATATTPAAHYDAYTVYGTATRPGTYPVKARITNATVKKAVERWFTIVVDNLTDANGLLLVTDAVSGEPVPLRNARGEKYTVYAGVAEHGLPAITPFEESDKLTVSGLPAGLRYDAKLRKFTGVPTKAGTYTVTAKVKSGKFSYVSTFTIEVEPLPDWAVGTFTGFAFQDLQYEADSGIFFTVTVSSQGKCACRAMTDYESCNLRGLRLSRNEEGKLCIKAEGYIEPFDPDAYWELELAITPVDLGEGQIGRGDLTMCDFTYGEYLATDDKYPLWQDVWNRPDIPSIDGKFTSVSVDCGYDQYRIGLRFGKKGAVTASLAKNGQAVSVATTGRLALHSVDGGWWQGDLPLILSSKDKEVGEFGALLSVTVSPDGTVFCKVEHFERNWR